MVTLKFLGGAGTVTGSKFLLTFDHNNLLVDCGLFQGVKNLRELNWASLPLPADAIDAVVLTHAHLDHSGYLPRLVHDGFRGKIYSTPATRDVAELILKDSAHLQEKDAELLNRHSLSKHKPALPLYTVQDAVRALQHFSRVEFNQTALLNRGARVHFRYAGHILGAANVQIDWGGKKIVFSGDIGRYNDPIMRDPETPPDADYVIIESTYGDRRHPEIDATDALGDVAERTLKRGGTLIIPAFAVGRAQEILYHLWKLKESGRLAGIPIYLDSPMAIDATELMSAHISDHRLSPQACRRAFSIARYTNDVDSSKAITASSLPKIVISASGMATGGRVLHHLKSFGPDPRNTILLAGFQAAGTRGRSLRDGSRELKIYGSWIPINAEVVSLEMLSAHADATELIRWLSGFKRAPKGIFIVHGEPEASDALRVRIERQLGWTSLVPRQDQKFML